MKKPAKILLLIATIWPFIYGIIFFVIMLSTFSSMPMNGRTDLGAIDNLFRVILPLHLLTMLDVLSLTIFYMVNVFRNDRVAKDKKALWAAVIFLGNVIAMPVYWYYYIWQEENDSHDGQAKMKSLHSADGLSWVDYAEAHQRKGEYVPPPEPPDWR